ncbi:Gamma-glutamyltranspeptidase [Dactylella cylindrospora]|nr:Gamma-glutamyltranspeptidase [Dactylella cylindrospora]
MWQSRSQPPASHDEETAAEETQPLVSNANNSNANNSNSQNCNDASVRANLSRWLKWFNNSIISKIFTSLLGSLLPLFIAAVLIYYLVREHQKSNRDADADLQQHLIKARHGAVASDVGVCSQIGVDMLQLKNGTAVDAIVATALCIGVFNMYASGIGGGGFMVIRHPNGTSKAVNFREMAPGASHKEMYSKDPLMAQNGGLAVGIPGEVKGFYEAWKMYGRVEWKELFEPSIRLCEEGFNATWFLGKVIESEKEFLKQADKREWGFLFNEGTGELLKEGDLVKRPALGKTLRKIAENGPDAFYKGEVAETLAEFVQGRGGILTAEDLGMYKVEVEDTLKVWAFGQEILTCPPPCSLTRSSSGHITKGHSPRYNLDPVFQQDSGRPVLHGYRLYMSMTSLGIFLPKHIIDQARFYPYGLYRYSFADAVIRGAVIPPKDLELHKQVL